MRRNVVLDTSFVVKCAEWRIDLLSELDRVLDFPYVLRYIEGTKDELEVVAAQGRAGAHAAKVARLFLRKASPIKAGVGLVDDLIVKYAKDHVSAVVATHDAELKRRIKKLGRPVVFIRQKKYLQVG